MGLEVRLRVGLRRRLSRRPRVGASLGTGEGARAPRTRGALEYAAPARASRFSRSAVCSRLRGAVKVATLFAPSGASPPLGDAPRRGSGRADRPEPSPRGARARTASVTRASSGLVRRRPRQWPHRRTAARPLPPHRSSTARPLPHRSSTAALPSVEERSTTTRNTRIRAQQPTGLKTFVKALRAQQASSHATRRRRLDPPRAPPRRDLQPRGLEAAAITKAS